MAAEEAGRAGELDVGRESPRVMSGFGPYFGGRLGSKFMEKSN